MKDSFVITKSGYGGDDIRKVNPINPSIKSRSATEQPVYERFVVDNNELLNKDEREAIVNYEKIERGNQNPQEAYVYLNSNYNPVKENLLEQNKSRK